MSFFKHDSVSSIPDGCTPDSVRIERSICTGEATIGFYDPKSKALRAAELVRTERDIQAFCRKYGVQIKLGIDITGV